MGEASLLYLDDERINLLAFKAQFRRYFEVYCAATTEEAFRILQTERVDFVFSDQRMPNTSGTEFLQQVYEKQPQAIRAIISGYADDIRITEAKEQGLVQAVFEKPYRSTAVMKFIEEHTRQQTEGPPA